MADARDRYRLQSLMDMLVMPPDDDVAPDDYGQTFGTPLRNPEPPNAGQKRRQWLEDAVKPISEAARYYGGPTGIPERLGAANDALNPVVGVQDSMQASQRMFAPGRTMSERAQDALGASLGVLGAVLPAGAAKYAGATASNALMEGILGFSPKSALDTLAGGQTPSLLDAATGSQMAGSDYLDYAESLGRDRTNMFLGPNSTMARENPAAIEKAKLMHGLGASREAQARSTGGWTIDADGSPTYEIPDRLDMVDVKRGWDTVDQRGVDAGAAAVVQSRAERLGVSLEEAAELLRQDRMKITDSHVELARNVPRDKLRAMATGRPQMMLPDVLDHPELYRQYPKLADVEVRTKVSDPGYAAAYFPDTNSIEINPRDPNHASTLLHEVNHAVTQLEPERAVGGNYQTTVADDIQRVKAEQKAIASKGTLSDFNTFYKRERQAGRSNNDILQSPDLLRLRQSSPDVDRWLTLEEENRRLQAQGRDDYRKLTDEVRSRNVQWRAERYGNTLPAWWKTQDTKDADKINVYEPRPAPTAEAAGIMGRLIPDEPRVRK